MKLLQKDMPIIIMTGIRDRFSAFIKNNPDINGLFEYRFDLNMFSDTDLTNLCCDMLEKDWNFKKYIGKPLPDPNPHFTISLGSLAEYFRRCH